MCGPPLFFRRESRLLQAIGEFFALKTLKEELRVGGPAGEEAGHRGERGAQRDGS